MTTHYLLGGSNAPRWVKCPASLFYEEHFGSRDGGGASPAAAEGTRLHEKAARILDNYNSVGRGLPHHAGLDPDFEMLFPYIDYVNYLRDGPDASSADEAWIEIKTTVPNAGVDCGGAVDFAAYHARTKTLHVVDYKSGKGIVNAYDNHQFDIYSIGLVDILQRTGRDVGNIVHTVVQPAGWQEPVRSVSYTAVEFTQRAAVVYEAIEQYKSGEATIKSGSHCTYCPALLICEETKRHMATLKASDVAKIEKGTISTDELAELNEALQHLEFVSQAAEKLTTRLAFEGTLIPRHKMIRGRGSKSFNETIMEHVIRDTAELKPYITKLYKTELISPAAAEKVIPKAIFAEHLAPLVIELTGKLKVVHESERGKAIEKIDTTFEPIIEDEVSCR